MEVRRADLNDVDHLAMLRAEWRGHPPDERYLADFREWFVSKASDRWWWVAVESGAAVGMVNLAVFERMPTPDRGVSSWGYLANLFVTPRHRGVGAGSALVRAVLARARDERLARVVLHPSDEAAPMYRRLGFRTAEELLLLPLE